jgi:ubiquinone/menaquinone biosynthesis C-methylase UbiE
MTSLVEEMRAYYARRAPVYDASMGYDDPAKVARLQPVANSLRRQMKDRTALEIACGPGFWTQVVSEVATAVAATDCNESVLAEARKKPLDWRKVSLLVADAYDLSAATGAYDAAFAVDWLAHVPKSRFHEFLEGLHKRLEANARVVFCDQLAGPDSWTDVYDDEGNHLQERHLPDGSRYQVIKHFLSDTEFQDLFSRYTDHVDIERYPESRRVVVGYTL